MPPLPTVIVSPCMPNAPAAPLKVIERTLQAPSASASRRSVPVKTRAAVPLLGGALVVQLLSLLHFEPMIASPAQVNVAACAGGTALARIATRPRAKRRRGFSA